MKQSEIYCLLVGLFILKQSKEEETLNFRCLLHEVSLLWAYSNLNYDHVTPFLCRVSVYVF